MTAGLPSTNAPGRISFVSLVVSDPARASRFYASVLGLRPGRGGEGYLMFEAAGATLALMTAGLLGDIAGGGLRAHPGGSMISFNVADPGTVDAILDRAGGLGAVITRAPHATAWGGFAGCFRDPEGHLWEVVHNPKVRP